MLYWAVTDQYIMVLQLYVTNLIIIFSNLRDVSAARHTLVYSLFSNIAVICKDIVAFSIHSVHFLQRMCNIFHPECLRKGIGWHLCILLQVIMKIAQCLSHWTSVGSFFESSQKKCWNESRLPYWQNFTQETPGILQSRCFVCKVHLWNLVADC